MMSGPVPELGLMSSSPGSSQAFSSTSSWRSSRASRGCSRPGWGGGVDDEHDGHGLGGDDSHHILGRDELGEQIRLQLSLKQGGDEVGVGEVVGPNLTVVLGLGDDDPVVGAVGEAGVHLVLLHLRAEMLHQLL